MLTISDERSELLRKWNAAVKDFNSVVAPRNVGRPLEASEAQRAQVLNSGRASVGYWTRGSGTPSSAKYQDISVKGRLY